MDQNNQIAEMLRKLAAAVRKVGEDREQDKLRKLAQAATCAAGLGLLARKLGK